MSQLAIHIIVPGEITPWKRAQRRRLSNGAHRTFTDPKVEAYHAVVRLAAERAMAGQPPIADPIVISLLAVFLAPKMSGIRTRECLAGLRHKETQPDVDNSIKGALDAMQSIVYRNDGQIAGYRECFKVFGDRPRLEILVEPVPHGMPLPIALWQPFAAPPAPPKPAAPDLFAEAVG